MLSPKVVLARNQVVARIKLQIIVVHSNLGPKLFDIGRLNQVTKALIIGKR